MSGADKERKEEEENTCTYIYYKFWYGKSGFKSLLIIYSIVQKPMMKIRTVHLHRKDRECLESC